MISWGISAASHNAALAVFKNNDLVFASESERFSRIKNDPHLNKELIDYALQFGEPETVFWYEKPFLKTLRQLGAGQGFQNNNVKKYLAEYGIVDTKIRTVPHHTAHVAGSYFTSGYDEAAIIIIDAIGEYNTATIWKAEKNNYIKMWSMNYPHSVGMFYSAMTKRIGLKPNEEEYILMGMAAYGDKNRLYKEILEDFVEFYDHGREFKFTRNLHQGCKYWRPDLCEEQDMFDIAAATQAVYETLLDHIVQKAKRLVKSDNLVFGGGCALNCMANPLLHNYYKNVWIMPAPGDNGSAIGAVLANYGKHIEWPGPYLGYDLGKQATNEEIVDHLLEHKMCGLARGKAEFGPRALGNRSLLADPRGSEIKALINTIKKRQQFRPFAPSIIEDFGKEVFLTPVKSTPYMQYIAKCKKSESYPAIIHHDNTSRVQTVSPDDDRDYYNLLYLWYQRTGCPMLLNTSLNIKGEPIVNDEHDVARWQEKYGVKIFT